MDAGQQLTVGFVGLGNMGWPMAANLHAAGLSLVVRDARPEVQDRFAAAHPGTVVAVDPGDFTAASIVVTMLPDGASVRDALLGWGIAAALKPGAIALDMSSSSPADTAQLAQAVRQFGVAVVDAPVSGGVPRAVTGELTIMAGGAPGDIAEVQSVLSVLGDPARQFRTGPLGTGHAMKALNNVVAAAISCVTAEALITGKQYGLDPGTMIDVLNASTGRSFVSELNYGAQVLTGRYGAGFRLSLMAKDVAIADGAARGAGVDAPMIALTQQRWSAAAGKLGPQADVTQAHQAWSDEPLTRGEGPETRSEP